jgi:hypothetical protein
MCGAGPQGTPDRTRPLTGLALAVGVLVCQTQGHLCEAAPRRDDACMVAVEGGMVAGVRCRGDERVHGREHCDGSSSSSVEPLCACLPPVWPHRWSACGAARPRSARGGLPCPRRSRAPCSADEGSGARGGSGVSAALVALRHAGGGPVARAGALRLQGPPTHQAAATARRALEHLVGGGVVAGPPAAGPAALGRLALQDLCSVGPGGHVQVPQLPLQRRAVGVVGRDAQVPRDETGAGRRHAPVPEAGLHPAVRQQSRRPSARRAGGGAARRVSPSCLASSSSHGAAEAPVRPGCGLLALRLFSRYGKVDGSQSCEPAGETGRRGNGEIDRIRPENRFLTLTRTPQRRSYVGPVYRRCAARLKV